MLDYNLEERGDLSLYDYLYQRIRNDIVNGEIAPEERLPSKRSLAQHLGVSVITVESAYAQLVAEGYVLARPRSGYFAKTLPSAPVAPLSVRETPRDLTGERTPAVSYSSEAAHLWSRALRAALASEPDSELYGTAPSQGSLRLRRAIADHLRRSRGVIVNPSCIVVAAGAQVLDIMLAQLLGLDSVWGVEDPGYPRLTSMYTAMGLRVRHVPLDAEGVCVADLVERGVDVLHIMPSHQFPTGTVTSIARRYELLSWASSALNRYIVEDDYDCEFRLAGRPVPSLASIDAPGRVIYTNTFSKSLSSALRLAYMVLPPALMERYGSELGFYSSTLSSVEQVVLARLLEGGDYERHVNRMRRRARDKRDAFVDALGEASDQQSIRVEAADAGLHLVLAVHDERPEGELAGLATAAGVALTPLSSYAFCSENAAASDGLRRFCLQLENLPAGDPSSAALALVRGWSA